MDARTTPTGKDGIPGVLLPVGALLLGVAAMVAGNGSLATLVVLRLDLDSHSPLVAGAVMTCYYLGFLVGALAAPRAIPRVGLIRTFAAAAATCAGAAIAHGLIDGPLAWALLRLTGGVAWAVLLVTVETWLSAHADDASRGVVLAAYMMVFYLALGGGQFALAAFDPAEGRLFAGAGLCLCLAVVPVALTRHEAPATPSTELLGLRVVLERAPLAMVASIGSGALLACFLGLGPLFARSLGFDAVGAARWMGAGILGGLVLQVPVGRLSDRIGRRGVLGGVCVVLIGNCVAFWLLPHGVGWLAFALATLFGALTTTIYPLALAHATDWFEPHERTAACSSLVLGSAAGSVVGPIAAAGVMAELGPRGLFVIPAGVAAVIAVHSSRRALVRPAKPVSERDPYVAVPRTTATVVEFDQPPGSLSE